MISYMSYHGCNNLFEYEFHSLHIRLAHLRYALHIYLVKPSQSVLVLHLVKDCLRCIITAIVPTEHYHVRGVSINRKLKLVITEREEMGVENQFHLCLLSIFRFKSTIAHQKVHLIIMYTLFL